MPLKQKKVFKEAFLISLTNLLVVGGAFLTTFFLMKSQLHMQAVDLPLIKTGFDYSGLDLIVKIKNLTPFIGVGIAAVYSLVLLFLLVIFTGLRRKSNTTTFIINLVVLSIFSVLAIDLVFLEPRFTAAVSAIKSFIGVPMSVSMIAAFVLCLGWPIIRNLKGSGKFSLLLLLVLNFSGCSLIGSASVACEISPDSDHCYQFSAVQSGEEDKCEKIEGEGFSGQNPPKDKCYLMEAVNKSDYSICDNIEGGVNSYTKEQCISEVAISKKDVEECRKVENRVSGLNCASQIPSKGDNPLKEGETIAAEITDVQGDVRIVKDDGRVIPLTQDSVMGPKDRIMSMEDSSFTFQKTGKEPVSCSAGTLIFLDDKYDTLEGACAGAAPR